MRDDGKKIIVRPASKASVDCSSGIAHLACFLDAPAFARSDSVPATSGAAGTQCRSAVLNYIPSCHRRDGVISVLQCGRVVPRMGILT